MRKESRTIISAFMQRKAKSAKNTSTDGNILYLFGNKIAWFNPDGSVSMTLAGWPTVTTRDRLNTLCYMMYDSKPFHQKDHCQYFDGSEIGSADIITYHPLEKLAA